MLPIIGIRTAQKVHFWTLSITRRGLIARYAHPEGANCQQLGSRAAAAGQPRSGCSRGRAAAAVARGGASRDALEASAERVSARKVGGWVGKKGLGVKSGRNGR